MLLRAQVVGATLSGTVTDPTGKVIADATVTLLNTAQGNSRTTKTNADGLYVAPNLVLAHTGSRRPLPDSAHACAMESRSLSAIVR